MTEAEALIRGYYAAFNAGEREAMLALLAEDVVHDINQGPSEAGKPAFRRFLQHMGASYREEILDLVVMVDTGGTRAAAEFIVVGHYLRTGPGLPEARGQRYRLPAGGFFALADGRISRVTTCYNLAEWIRQIGG